MEKKKGESNISTVSLIKCQNYDETAVDAAVVKAVSLLGGINKYIKPSNRVLLKVNLLTGTAPEDAVTTHPAVVRAMIHQVKAASGTPLVGDCSGFEGPPNEGRYLSVCRNSRLTA